VITQQLRRANAFVHVDLETAPVMVGPVRLAPKVLRESAELLARCHTYSFALFNVMAGGASAGINADPDERDAQLSLFIDELASVIADGSLKFYAGFGVRDVDLIPLGGITLDPANTGWGVAAATAAALGDPAGKRVAVVGDSPALRPMKVALAGEGAEVVDGQLGTEADAVVVAGRAGLIDHEVGNVLNARVLVPMTPLPVTSRGYAVLKARGVVYVPDFLALAAPLLQRFDASGGDPVRRIKTATAEILEEGKEDAWRVASERSEAFMTTWQNDVPFGRPLV
jgi:Glu/Leu/Phe/Val dehydrogenase, dimerisation domain